VKHALLEAGEQTALCCDLRRSRRTFIDNYLNQLWLRCENPAARMGHRRRQQRQLKRACMIYLAEAEQAVRALYQDQAVAVGRLSGGLDTSKPVLACTVFDCPFSPHTLTRFFFISLPDLPMPLRVRYRLAGLFVKASLPRFSTYIAAGDF
jgi:hypothetical protein